MLTVEIIGVEFGIHPLSLRVAMETMLPRVMHSAVHVRQDRNGQNSRQGVRVEGVKETVGIRKESRRESRKTLASLEVEGKLQRILRLPHNYKQRLLEHLLLSLRLWRPLLHLRSRRISLSALKKVSADLPQEVQTALQKMQSDDSRQLTKQLHSAVSQLGNSKKTLADLTSAPPNLHQSWSAFLESAIGRWERYAEEFSQQDRDLATQIEKAKETMKICKDHFKSLQALEGAASEPTTEVISDDEENSIPSKVDVHMKQMQESLKILKGGMEEELRGQKAAKIGRNHGTGWWCSTMWSGRQVSDSLIACRPASKQWLLNAVHLNDFVAPWKALDRAADLAWELGFLPHANLSFPVLEVPTPRRLNKKVRFHDLVTLRMTTDKLETTYVIPDGLLSM